MNDRHGGRGGGSTGTIERGPGHHTTTIPRATRDRTGPSGRLTRPGEDTRLLRRPRSRWLAATVGAVIVLALAATLFVLPIRHSLAQRRQLADTQGQLAELKAANDRLAEQNAQLETSAGVERAARDDLGYQLATERVAAALPPPQIPAALPPGWPNDLVGQILSVRTIAALEAASAPATTVAPAPAPAAAPAAIGG